MCLLTSIMVVTMVMGTMRTTTAKRYSERTLSGRINPDELSQMGISSEDFYEHLKHLSDGNVNCGMHTMMTRHYIRNKTVTCNDGTASGYYLRRSSTSSRWVIYLDGGWFCFDESSCHRRWIQSSRLMGSYNWTPSRKGSGILSADQTENPYMYDVNAVAIPYCSSDVWSGNRYPRTKNDFAFLGSLILEEVIKDLVYAHGLGDATIMFLAGSSAGGTGVLVNLDRVAGIMSHIARRVHVRGIVDSGWFLDNQQYQPSPCTDVYSCSPTASIQKGMRLWHGQVPDNCKKQYTESEHWRCYFGYRVYPTLKTPVFVVQHLFDEAQITVDNVGSPVKREQWQYIHDVGQDMRQTLINVSAVFAPSCLSHILLTRSDWNMVSIRGVTLPQAIKCWESGANEKNLYSRTTQGNYYIQLAERLITGEKSPLKPQADSPPRPRRKQNKHRHKRKGTGAKKGGGKRKRLRERELRKKQKARERAQKKKEKDARRKREHAERKKRKRQERLQAARKIKNSAGGGGIHHHLTVYDYVIEQPGGVVEHRTAEKSIYFNPLQPHSNPIQSPSNPIQSPSNPVKTGNPAETKQPKGESVQPHKTPSQSRVKDINPLQPRVRKVNPITADNNKKSSKLAGKPNANNSKKKPQINKESVSASKLKPSKSKTQRRRVKPKRQHQQRSKPRTLSEPRKNSNKQPQPDPELGSSRKSKIPQTESHKKPATAKQKPKTKKTVKPKKSDISNNNNKKKKSTKTKLRPGRPKRSSLRFDEHDVHHMEYHSNRCNHHRIDHCEWPQCNFSCPKIYNHFTGEEMDFIDLFMQFGLDMSSLATALNMDLTAMERMDKNQLLNLLINT